ncbi:MAG: tetratricopeptide repeat protein [Gammaproteobacteria bacterium]|nr:tetratricopeptide repeat protein [Gammaproteobacteria bacterium]
MQHDDLPSPSEATFKFGAYRFDAGTGQLRSGQKDVRLSPKAAAVLQVLLARPGRPVNKEELFSTVWRGVVVTDHSLTRCIRELRAALGDDPKAPRFIETWHRRGYRFVAPVVTADEAETPSPAGTPDGEVNSIAVLPFADMSADRDQDYLCEGLAEELIGALTHVSGLRVAARSASFQFRGPAVDVRAVGRQLDVAALLEGSVRKAGDRLRIAVQLVDVESGFEKWSRRFDRRLDDVFAVQDEIAQSVATLLRGGNLSRRERQGLHRPETAPNAYEYYLRARQLLHSMKQTDLERSRDLFALALELDGSYAPAWAGLATVHAVLYEWFIASDSDLEHAHHASRKALELSPRLADAHVARGLTLSLSGRYDEARRDFEEAIAINPNLFDAYYYYGRCCFACGEIGRSAELFRKAASVRQEDFQSSLLLEQSLRVLGLEDDSRAARCEGIARAERVLELNPDDGRALALLPTALVEGGDCERALALLQRALDLYPDDPSTLVNSACVYAKLGRKEEALNLLEQVFGRGCGKRHWIERDPDYDILRDDPRFKAMLDRLK